MIDSSKTSYSVESIMLHDLYKSTIDNLTIILNKYIINNFRLLKKGLLEKDYESFASLILISLGPNLVLNLGFTVAIKSIMKVSEYGANQTHVMSTVGNSIISQMQWMFLDISSIAQQATGRPAYPSVPSYKVKKNIKIIMGRNSFLKGRKLEEFTNIFTQYIGKLNEIENSNVLIPFNVGQTIVSLLLSKDKVFKRNLMIVDNKTSEVL